MKARIVLLLLLMLAAGGTGWYLNEPPSLGVVSLSGLEIGALPSLSFSPGSAPADVSGRLYAPSISRAAASFAVAPSAPSRPGGIGQALQKMHDAASQEEERLVADRRLRQLAGNLIKAANRRLEERRQVEETRLQKGRDPQRNSLSLDLLNAEIALSVAKPDDREQAEKRVAEARRALTDDDAARRSVMQEGLLQYKKGLEADIEDRLSKEREAVLQELRSEKAGRSPRAEPSPLHVVSTAPDISSWAAAEKAFLVEVASGQALKEAERGNAALAGARQLREARHSNLALKRAAASLAAERGLSLVIAGAVPLKGCVDLTGPVNDILKKGRQEE